MLYLSAAIFAALLIASGGAKAMRPTDTARALSQMGVTGGTPLVRVLALVEIGTGVWVLATMSTLALWLQTGLYAVFAGWVVVALARGVPMASCGCLGRDDTPPYWGHVILNLAAVVVTLGAILIGGEWMTGGGLEAGVSLLIVAVGAWLGWQILGEGARVSGMVES